VQTSASIHRKASSGAMRPSGQITQGRAAHACGHPRSWPLRKKRYAATAPCEGKQSHGAAAALRVCPARRVSVIGAAEKQGRSGVLTSTSRNQPAPRRMTRTQRQQPTRAAILEAGRYAKNENYIDDSL
jgi:hypothetical protein